MFNITILNYLVGTLGQLCYYYNEFDVAIGWSDYMKNKIFYILIVITALLFAGCKRNDQETYFIPTPAPDSEKENTAEAGNNTSEEEDGQIAAPENSSDETGNESDSEAEKEPVYTGDTTTMYVKLNSFGAILNVRSSPSTSENNVVGFLVHTEPVEVISIENGWASFLYKGEICYVSADYLVDYVPPYISPSSSSTSGN